MVKTIVRKYHLDVINEAVSAIENLPKEQRNVSSTAISLSPESYKIALERINALNLELLEIAKADKNVNGVYGLNINLFPFTTGESA